MVTAECVRSDAFSKFARYSGAYNRQFHTAYKLLKERQPDVQPDSPGGGETENNETKPIPKNSPEIQYDTATFTIPNEPNVAWSHAPRPAGGTAGTPPHLGARHRSGKG